MRGTILSFDSTNTGYISGFDGVRYSFTRNEWQDSRDPAKGQEVDFRADGQEAKEIILISLGKSQQYTKTTLALVSFFVGFLGIHRFMVGKTGSGVVMLIFSLTFFGLFISVIWNLVDLIMIITGKFTDKDGNLIE